MAKPIVTYINLKSPDPNRFCHIYGENTFIFAKDEGDENIYLVTVFPTTRAMKKIMLKQENLMKGCDEYEE